MTEEDGAHKMDIPEDNSPKSSSVRPTPPVAQMTKLREANNKYKSLLKLAKERIQTQEDELEQLRAENARLEEAMQQTMLLRATSNHSSASDRLEEEVESSSANVVRVIQLMQVDHEDEIWALVEFDASGDAHDAPRRYYKKWKQFASSLELSDYLRRDTGEPIVLPPYSLSATQSAQIQQQAQESVRDITEEFRRFRVKSEIAKKQADSQIRDLQQQNLSTTQRRMESTPQDDNLELLRQKQEMEEQETRWKEAYSVLMAENKTLKSSGSEALLAAQWRQRYETCLKEKQDISAKLEILEQASGDKYEAKYRDLKESFRLYRQKAKEIFEAQQRGEMSPLMFSQGASEDAKMDYLKNLMVNYLSSDADVREHMEPAIGTVLKFSDEDFRKIEKKKAEDSDAWFGISVS